ncbi:MAG TPA: hypothetical protein VEZ90_03005, partial [Blastocatellia bacterium]|nr:hypothetical protein [Blastocatellia bacterium]
DRHPIRGYYFGAPESRCQLWVSSGEHKLGGVHHGHVAAAAGAYALGHNLNHVAFYNVVDLDSGYRESR